MRKYPEAIYIAAKKMRENPTKAEEKLNLSHQAQIINYLKATNIKVGLLINLGKEKCDFKRLIF